MNSKKASPKVSKVTSPISTPVVEATEYASDLAYKRARLSGIALKSSTAKSAGSYLIEAKDNGTSVVLGSLYNASFKGKENVPAPDFGSALSSLFSGKSPESDKVVEKEIALYEKRAGKKYGNFSTLRARILSEIRRGTILSFKLDSAPARS